MKDVRRALLFWPAFTSALIILIALISPLEDGSWQSVSNRFAQKWSGNKDVNEASKTFGTNTRLGTNTRKVKTHAQIHADSGLAYAPISLALTEPETGETLRKNPGAIVLDNEDTIERLNQEMFADQGNFTLPQTIARPQTLAPVQATILPQEPVFSQPALHGADSELSRIPTPDGTPLDMAPLDRATAASPVDLSHPLERSTLQARVHQPLDTPIEIGPALPRGEQSGTQKERDRSNDVRSSVLPKSVRSLAKMRPRIENASRSDRMAEEANRSSAESRDSHEPTVKPTVTGNPGTWPLTPRLIEQLTQLTEQLPPSEANSRPIHDWATSVSAGLSQLNSLPRLGDSDAGELIEQLNGLASSGLQHAERIADRQIQITYLQTAHGLKRRMAVWQPVWTVVSQQHSADSLGSKDATETDVASSVNSIRSELAATGDADGWADFLMLQELADAATNDNANVRSSTAKRVLSRIQWHGLTPIHREWLNRKSIDQLVAALQPWSQSPIDYAALLNQVERKESDAIDLADIDIASATQTLRYSSNVAATQVALAIDTHYRNANIRTAISQEMLSRLIPTVEPTTVPVRTNMLGSRVKGISHVNSQIELQLQPAAGSWAFLLQTQGNVHTHSVGQKGQTQVRTRGQSNFAAATPIAITPNGVDLGESSINVQGNTRLRNVHSQYDSWPLLGSLARTIITAKYNERSGLTSRIANKRMRTQIVDGIDERLEAKVAKSTTRLNDVVMGPLHSLKLQPKVIDMQTTDDRLIARYRLAGDLQIGASTPRPRAPSDSLLSVQINQSALNNTLEQIVPQGTPTTLQSAFDNTMAIFGRPSMPLPADIPTDVQIQFTKARPITIEMEEGILWITMRVVELSREKGGKLNRFIVRAGYRPEIDGLRVSLVRDGHLRISGPGMAMRQRLPIRAIFNKVFSPNHKIPVTNETFANAESLADCAISQVELRDGWMALAVSPARPEQIAELKSNVK